MNKSDCRGILEAHLGSTPVNPDLKQQYMDVLEHKWERILESIQGNRAYKYIFLPTGARFWVIVGKTDEYLQLPPFYCSCHDFYFNAISKKKEVCCYHLIAQMICERSSRFTTIIKDDGSYLEYLEDLLDRN